MWSWTKLSLAILLSLTFSIPLFADDGVSRTRGVVENYPEEGSFYWTRLYWQGTMDGFRKGKLFFVDENGEVSQTNLWLVIGMDKTVEQATDLAQYGWQVIKVYADPTTLLPDCDDVQNITRAAKRAYVKPRNFFIHKWEKTTDATKENLQKITDSGLNDWGLAGRILGAIYYGGSLIIDPIRILAVETPVEFALRMVPKHGGQLLWELSKPIIRPFVPLVITSGSWFVLEPLNAGVNGGLATAVGLTGTVVTGLTATVEGTKYVAWDWWHDNNVRRVADGKQVGAFLKVPDSPNIYADVKNVLASVSNVADLKHGFDRIIEGNKGEEWVAMSYINSLLSETIETLKQNASEYDLTDQQAIAQEIYTLSVLRGAQNIALNQQFKNGI